MYGEKKTEDQYAKKTKRSEAFSVDVVSASWPKIRERNEEPQRLVNITKIIAAPAIHKLYK
jgi:hypothetical protein